MTCRINEQEGDVRESSDSCSHSAPDTFPGRQLPNVPVPAAWQAQESLPTALLAARAVSTSPGLPWIPPGGLGQPLE